MADLTQFVYVEDLVEHGLDETEAVRFTTLSGDVRHRPDNPDPAFYGATRADTQNVSRTGQAGTVRTLTEVRQSEAVSNVTMPMGTYAEVLKRGRGQHRGMWT